MTLKEFIDKENNEKIYLEDYDDSLEEAKVVTPLNYLRYWREFPKNERHYSKKTHNRLYGMWVYYHREAAGAKYGDGKIVHHKDENKHNNSKSNLQKITQSEHCKVDPNARKCYKCKICGKPHYARGLCLNCYMKALRSGKFGDYNPENNKSKNDR